MINRRRFLQSVAAAAITSSLTQSCRFGDMQLSPLQRDPNGIIELQAGFSYTVVSTQGVQMSDGLRVPGAHDGMAAFAGDDGRIVLICNHELDTQSVNDGPFGDNFKNLPESIKARVYDRGADRTPGLGSTTTTIYNPSTREVERQFLSLAGTELNCAGGKTPWDSWLSCEECFEDPGDFINVWLSRYRRDRRHGYVFEVPASASGLVEARPLQDMGRFMHEAVAVHDSTGIVYLTEDRRHGLFYRFVPHVPGQLHKGGRLQALAIAGEPSKQTHNWEADDIRLHAPLPVQWINLENVDADDDDLRKRGAAAGAATFARGEGLTPAGDEFAFACTTGGPARLGQVFTYAPSPYEGTDRERSAPGKLTLIAESNERSLLKSADNLTMAPWGDLLLCEDTEGVTDHCALVGIRPDGSQYLVANNAYSASELAGVCFSPDGKIMFINIQYPGMTIAITGPWPT